MDLWYLHVMDIDTILAECDMIGLWHDFYLHLYVWLLIFSWCDAIGFSNVYDILFLWYEIWVITNDNDELT